MYSYKIYKTVDANVDQIAIEHKNFSHVDVYVWSPDYRSVKYEDYTSKTFAKMLLDIRFKYIGDATTGKLILYNRKFSNCQIFKFCPFEK